MKHKILIVFIFLLFLCNGIFAVTLSMDEAVELAMKNSFTLREEGLSLKNTKKSSKVAWGKFMPTGEAYLDITTPNSDRYFRKFGLEANISVSLAFNPSIISAVKAAKQNYELGKLSYEQTKMSVEAEVKKIYCCILMQQELVKVFQASSDAQGNALAVAKHGYDAGTVSKSEYLKAEVAYKNALFDLQQAKLNLKESINGLLLITGIDSDEDIVFSDIDYVLKKPVVDESVMDSVVESSFAVRGIDAEIALLKARKNEADFRKFVPTLTISQSWNPLIDDLGNAKHTNHDDGYFSAKVAWNITDVLPWSDISTGASDYDTKYEQALLEKERISKDLENRIRLLVDRINSCVALIEASDKNIEVAEDSYAVAETEFNNGVIGISELCYAETQLCNARSDKISAYYDYLCSVIDLNLIIGN